MLPFFSQVFQSTRRLPWLMWAVLLLLPLGAGVVAFQMLGQMEGSECQAIDHLSDAPDSTKLYCAQMLANRQESHDLTQAVQLASSIAPDHPLKADSDRRVQGWSEQLLDMAQARYDDGKLDEGLELLKAIPMKTSAYARATRHVDEWQEAWRKAEAIYEEAQKALSNDELNIAQSEARKLLKIPNHYWRITRFQALVNEIQASRENKKNQTAASKPAKPGFSDKPLSTDDLVARWNKEQEGEANRYLQKAKQLARGGDVGRLRDAIAQAQMVFSGTSEYREAQQLIAEWNRRIETAEDRPYLDRAIALANKGDLASLQAAISEANNIYFGRSLYKEAQSNIDSWTIKARELGELQSSQELPPPFDSPRSDGYYRYPTLPR